MIAPVFGFDDYQDYYRKTQSGQFLKGVRVPFLAVQVRSASFGRKTSLPGENVPMAGWEEGGQQMKMRAICFPEIRNPGLPYLLVPALKIGQRCSFFHTFSSHPNDDFSSKHYSKHYTNTNTSLLSRASICRDAKYRGYITIPTCATYHGRR